MTVAMFSMLHATSVDMLCSDRPTGLGYSKCCVAGDAAGNIADDIADPCVVQLQCLLLHGMYVPLV